MKCVRLEGSSQVSGLGAGTNGGTTFPNRQNGGRMLQVVVGMAAVVMTY